MRVFMMSNYFKYDVYIEEIDLIRRGCFYVLIFW